MSTLEDQPIPYALTGAGWAATRAPQTLTTKEAAERRGWTPDHVARLCQRGVVDAVQVGRQWLIDGDSLDAYDARLQQRPRTTVGPREPRLPAAPLLRAIALRGGAHECGVQQHSAEEKALERAAEEGELTVWAADRLCVRLLGLTPWELWGPAYDC